MVLVRSVLAEWRQIEATTGAQHLQVQLAYAAAVLADDSEADDLFLLAIATAAAGWPFFAARAKLEYGAWLRRQRRAAESRVPLRQAAETFDAWGRWVAPVRPAGELREPWVKRRDVELLRLGRSWTRAGASGRAAAAEGLSNKEIAEPGSTYRLGLSVRISTACSRSSKSRRVPSSAMRCRSK